MSLRRVPLGLLVVLLALFAHRGAVLRHLGGAPGSGFHYDDESVVLLNRANLEDAGTVVRFFSDPSVFSGIPGNPMFRPVAHASHVLDAHLWGWGPEGPRPAGWHATNLLLHAAAAWVLYRLLRRVLSAWPLGEPFAPGAPAAAEAAAFLGALWFALQPVNAEVVNYVSARSESLAAVFFLLALLAHHAAWEEGAAPGRRRRLVAASLAAGALSFGCKETGVLLPAVAAALEVWGRPGEAPLRARLRTAALRAAPLAALLLGFLAVRKAVLGTAAVDLAARAAMEGAGVDPMVGGGRALGAHVLTQVRVLPAYALLLLLPVGLAPDHAVRVAASVDGPVLLALLLLAAAAALAVLAAARGGRATPLAAAWAAAALAPSVLVPLNVLMNEHRLYLPATGAALAAGIGLHRTLAAARRAGRAALGAAGAGAIALFAFFAMVDDGRALDWSDPVRLWTKAVEASPGSWRAHLHLGVEAFRDSQGEFGDMEALAGKDERAALFKKESAEGLLALAEAEFVMAHALYAGAFETRLNLGFFHLYRGMIANRDVHPDEAPARPEDFREAIRWFTLAEEASPGSFRALYNRATAMGKAGMVAEAIAEFERLAQDRSRTTMYAYPLADLYRRAGRTEDALRQLDLVERIEPRDAGTVALRRGEVLTQARRLEEAEKSLRRAAEILGPGDPGPPLYMARLLVATGISENLPTAAMLWKAALERGHRPGPKDRALVEALEGGK